jgi:DUF438 domain-containing protein
LEPVIRKLKIQAIREQLALCLQTLESIDKELQIAPLTEEDRSALTRRSDDMLRESNVLQLTLDLLERQEREEHERGAATQG